MSSDHFSAGEPASVRGSLVGARLAFVAGRLGAEARAEILESLPPAEAKRMQSVAIAGDWFDYATLEAIDGRIQAALSAQSTNLAAELGFFTAEHNYRSVAKQIGELPSEKIPERLGRLSLQLMDFAQFEHADVGSADENHGTALVFTYGRPVSTFFCDSMLGYYTRTLELLGLRVITAKESECASRGGRRHRYEVWWSDVQVREEPPDPRAVRIIRQVAAADPDSYAARGATASSAEGPSPVRRMVLVLTTLVLAAVWGATDGYRLVAGSPPSAGPVADPVRRYRCSGDISALAVYDRPEIKINNKDEVPPSRLVIEQGRRTYTLAVPGLAANGAYVFTLSAFRDELGNAPATDEMPSLVRLEVVDQLRPRRCDCVPE